jgi:hypothetical protein
LIWSSREEGHKGSKQLYALITYHGGARWQSREIKLNLNLKKVTYHWGPRGMK